MDIAQGLSVFPLVFLLALPVNQLIGDPRWYLISIIPRDAAPQNIWQIHIADSVRPTQEASLSQGCRHAALVCKETRFDLYEIPCTLC